MYVNIRWVVIKNYHPYKAYKLIEFAVDWTFLKCSWDVKKLLLEFSVNILNFSI